MSHSREERLKRKFCVDCIHYKHPQCHVYKPAPYFVPRKWNCEEWKKNKK